MVGEEAREAKRVEQGFELREHLILAATKDVGQDYSSPVIQGMPPPAWLFLLAHLTPHFIGLGSLDSPDADLDVTGIQGIHKRGIPRAEGPPFFFNS